MRVRIIFWLKNRGAVVPFHHQHLLHDLVQEVLDERAHSHDAEYLNFSGLKGQTKVTNLGLSFVSSKVTLVFSGHSQELVEYFVKQLFKKESIKLGQLVLAPESVVQELEPEMADSCKFVCISPLVIASPKIAQLDYKKFIEPETDLFSDFLYESTMSRMEKSGYYTAEQIQGFFKFQVVPDSVYLDKVRAEHKKFARIYSINGDIDGDEVRGYTMPFVLYAHSEVQNFVFNCGLGEYTARGFGMVDLADAEFVHRTVPFEMENNIQLTSNFRPRERVSE